ncbi:MAG: hypothetical protein AAFP76_06325 [Bacteroidota bacterium]
MKKALLMLVIFVAVALTGYYYFAKQENPRIRWEVSPGYETNGNGVYGPRDQRTKPDGTGTYPDNGKDNSGTSQGYVIFGPIVSGGMGHKDSKATAEFVCGEGSKCTIKVRISSSIVGGSPITGERIKLSAQRLSDSGRPTGAISSITPHTGNAGTKEYTLTLDGCGKVRLTASFEETTHVDNPSGIQNKFRIRISSYSCS